MQDKFHINKKGTVEKCSADKRRCPYGSADAHFESKEQAYGYIEDQEMMLECIRKDVRKINFDYIEEFEKGLKDLTEYKGPVDFKYEKKSKGYGEDITYKVKVLRNDQNVAEMDVTYKPNKWHNYEYADTVITHKGNKYHNYFPNEFKNFLK